MDQFASVAIAVAVFVVAILLLVWMTASSGAPVKFRGSSGAPAQSRGGFTGAPVQPRSSSGAPAQPGGFAPPGSPYITAGPLRSFPPPGYFGVDTCGPCDNYNPQPEWKFMAPQANNGSDEGSCC